MNRKGRHHKCEVRSIPLSVRAESLSEITEMLSTQFPDYPLSDLIEVALSPDFDFGMCTGCGRTYLRKAD